MGYLKFLLRIVSKLPLAGTPLTRTCVMEVMASKTYSERISNLTKSSLMIMIWIICHSGQVLLGVAAILNARQTEVVPVYDAETFRFVAMETWRWQNIVIGVLYAVVNALVVLVECYLLHRIWNFHFRHLDRYPRLDVKRLANRLPGAPTTLWTLFSMAFTLSAHFAIGMVLDLI